MEKIIFSSNEESPSEIVRTIVLEMLKDETWNQFPHTVERFMYKVEFVGNKTVFLFFASIPELVGRMEGI